MAKFCTECGKEIKDGVAFCTECGASAPADAPLVSNPPPMQSDNAPVAAPEQMPPPPAPTNTDAAAPVKGSKFDPMTTGGYIGSMLLMSIPVLGWLIAIIWACGGCRKINKRNLARAMIIMLIIGLLAGIIIYFVGRTLLGNILESSGLNELIGQAGGLGELTGLLDELKELQNVQLPTQ